MKKIFALLLTLTLILNLCACAPKETIDGQEYKVLNNNFMIVKEYEYGTYLIATKDTGIMYIFKVNGYSGFLSPYLIYENDAIYGAVWIDEEIVPIPFATN